MARGANSLADIDGKGRENGAVDEGSSFPAVSAQNRWTARAREGRHQWRPLRLALEARLADGHR